MRLVTKLEADHTPQVSETVSDQGSDDFPAVEIPDDFFASDDEVAMFFDRWWTIREANGYYEFLDRAWITE